MAGGVQAPGGDPLNTAAPGSRRRIHADDGRSHWTAVIGQPSIVEEHILVILETDGGNQNLVAEGVRLTPPSVWRISVPVSSPAQVTDPRKNGS